MAIIKRNGNYQVKYRGGTGWITRTFPTRSAADVYQAELKLQRSNGTSIKSGQLSVEDYFKRWFATCQRDSSLGWRRTRQQHYRDFVRPVMGDRKVTSITPDIVADALNRLNEQSKSAQLQLHIFNLLRKMFGDAIEVFQLLTFNPCLKSLKPNIPSKEALHLNQHQLRQLLAYVHDRRYGLAIWIQLYMGLRVGELQALRWGDVDLDIGIIHVRRTYIRKDKTVRAYPKGGKQHSHRLPSELIDKLLKAKKGPEGFVVTSPLGCMMSYEYYYRTLRRYCRELGLPAIGTHGIRHSTSTIYIEQGATRQDIRELFAHSSDEITQRYIHHKDGNLDRIAKRVMLFPKCSQT